MLLISLKQCNNLCAGGSAVLALKKMSDYKGTRWKRTKKKAHKWKRIVACAGVVSLVGSYFYFNSESRSRSESVPISPQALMPIPGEAEEQVEDRLQAILIRHWEAMGGMHNWSKVDSIRLNGIIEREGQFVDICIVKKRPNQIRATVTLPLPGKDEEKMQIIRAHDGKVAWTATRRAGAAEMIKEELAPEAASKLLADAGVLPTLIKLWREGAAIELIGTSAIAGQDALQIKTATKAGQQYTFYLASDSYRLLAYESTDNDGRTTRTRITDFMKHGGVLIPRRVVIESTATGTSTMTTKSVEIGVGIYNEYFEAGQGLRTAKSQ